MMYWQHSFSSKHLFCDSQVLGTLLGIVDASMTKIWAVHETFKVLKGRPGYTWTETKQCDNLECLGSAEERASDIFQEVSRIFRARPNSVASWDQRVNGGIFSAENSLYSTWKNRTVSGWRIAAVFIFSLRNRNITATVNPFSCSPRSALSSCGRRK